MATKKSQDVDWESFLSGVSRGNTIEYGAARSIYWQGDASDSVFFLREGKVKLSVISQQGKEAIIAILDSGDFFGEGCLAGQPLRMASATAVTDCTLVRLEKSLMVRLLHEQHAQTQPRTGQGRADAAAAGADHGQITFFGLHG